MVQMSSTRGGKLLVQTDDGVVIGDFNPRGRPATSDEVLAAFGLRHSRQEGREHELVEMPAAERRARLAGEAPPDDGDDDGAA